jgi:hypothetical protein
LQPEVKVILVRPLAEADLKFIFRALFEDVWETVSQTIGKKQENFTSLIISKNRNEQCNPSLPRSKSPS